MGICDRRADRRRLRRPRASPGHRSEAAALAGLRRCHREGLREVVCATGRVRAAEQPLRGLTLVAWNDLRAGELLDQLNMPLLFAHELGHYVLEHRSSSPQVEMEANAQAVEILVRARRVDELQALTAFHGYLLSVHRSQASRGVLPGHASACQEIADLVRRYPKHETVTRTWECAK